MPLTTEQRRLNGRMGALKVHAAGKTNTAPARRAFDARFEHEVDPKGTLSPQERSRRALHARRLYFARLAFLAVAKRKAGIHPSDRPVHDATPPGVAALGTQRGPDGRTSRKGSR